MEYEAGHWTLHAYAPVFWCPYRQATCLAGAAITTNPSPCAYPASGTFCQDLTQHPGMFLDTISRHKESCVVGQVSHWFLVTLVLSCFMFCVLVYVSCWKVCKLERVQTNHGNRDKSDQNKKEESRNNSVWCCKLTGKGPETLKTIENNNNADDNSDNNNSHNNSDKKDKVVISISILQYLGFLGRPEKDLSLTPEVERVQYKLQSWLTIEWLAELLTLLMFWQILGTLPAALYTAFPPLTTIILKVFAISSLATPFMWPFSCLQQPSFLPTFLKHLSSGSTTTSSANNDNSMSLNYWQIMTLYTTIPLFLWLLVTCLYIFLYELFFLAKDETRRKRGQARLSTWYFSSVLTGYQVVLGGTSQLLGGSLQCVDLDPRRSVTETATTVLWQEPTLVCSGASYTYYRVWAVFSVIIYMFFVPMLCGAAIRCWRCTISVILHHPHRFIHPNYNAATTKSNKNYTTNKLNSINHNNNDNHGDNVSVGSSLSSSPQNSQSSSYFLVTGGDDVARLDDHNHRYSNHNNNRTIDYYSSTDEEEEEKEHYRQQKHNNSNNKRSNKRIVKHHSSTNSMTNTTHNSNAKYTMSVSNVTATNNGSIVDNQQGEKEVVSVKVSRTVRAAALLYTNFRPAYKYGILAEYFLRMYFLGLVPRFVSPTNVSVTQKLFVPFVCVVSGIVCYVGVKVCAPYRRVSVQRLVEMGCVQIVLLSLGAMLLQWKGDIMEDDDQHSSWMWLLDAALVAVLLIPVGYYGYQQYVRHSHYCNIATNNNTTNNNHNSTKNDHVNNNHHRHNNKDHAANRWSPEYRWLRAHFQHSHGLLLAHQQQQLQQQHPYYRDVQNSDTSSDNCSDNSDTYGEPFQKSVTNSHYDAQTNHQSNDTSSRRHQSSYEGYIPGSNKYGYNNRNNANMSMTSTANTNTQNSSKRLKHAAKKRRDEDAWHERRQRLSPTPFASSYSNSMDNHYFPRTDTTITDYYSSTNNHHTEDMVYDYRFPLHQHNDEDRKQRTKMQQRRTSSPHNHSKYVDNNHNRKHHKQHSQKQQNDVHATLSFPSLYETAWHRAELPCSSASFRQNMSARRNIYTNSNKNINYNKNSGIYTAASMNINGERQDRRIPRSLPFPSTTTTTAARPSNKGDGATHRKKIDDASERSTAEEEADDNHTNTNDDDDYNTNNNNSNSDFQSNNSLKPLPPPSLNNPLFVEQDRRRGLAEEASTSWHTPPRSIRKKKSTPQQQQDDDSSCNNYRDYPNTPPTRELYVSPPPFAPPQTSNHNTTNNSNYNTNNSNNNSSRSQRNHHATVENNSSNRSIHNSHNGKSNNSSSSKRSHTNHKQQNNGRNNHTSTNNYNYSNNHTNNNRPPPVSSFPLFSSYQNTDHHSNTYDDDDDDHDCRKMKHGRNVSRSWFADNNNNSNTTNDYDNYYNDHITSTINTRQQYQQQQQHHKRHHHNDNDLEDPYHCTSDGDDHDDFENDFHQLPTLTSDTIINTNTNTNTHTHTNTNDYRYGENSMESIVEGRFVYNTGPNLSNSDANSNNNNSSMQQNNANTFAVTASPHTMFV